MKRIHFAVTFTVLFCSLIGQAQTAATDSSAVVPPLVNFSGVLTDGNGKPLTGIVGVTFLLYKDSQGGAPLWMETQNVRPDRGGHYTVMLGSTRSTGLPADIFVAGEAHWLGVQVQGQDEQPRVLLVAVPYALKAGDAQTLGGLPASAFVLATAPTGNVGLSGNGLPKATATTTMTPQPASSNVTTTGGSVATLPLFATPTSIQNSLVTQTGTTAINIGGKLNLFATGTATAAGGKNSQPLNMTASAFNSSTNAAANQAFQWLVEAAGNDTATPSGALHLLSASGPSTPAETGLSIAGNGQITFAPGQTFSATNSASSFGVAVTGTTTGTGIGDYGVEGIANATSGLAAGVYGSGASPSGFGVVGISSANVGVYGSTNGTTSTSYGVEGYVNALVGPGVGVYGNGGVDSAAIGVEGVSNTIGVLGNATGSSSYGVEGKSPYMGVSGDAGTTGVGVNGKGIIGVTGFATAAGGYAGTFGGGPVLVNGNGNNALIGDAGCGSGYAGIGFTTASLSNCLNYALLGDTRGTTYINSSGGNGIHFRSNNNNLVTIDASGDLTVTGKVSDNNVIAEVSASNTVNPSSCGGTLSSSNPSCAVPNMTLTKTTKNPNVLVMVNIGGISTDACAVEDFYLVVDNKIAALSSISGNSNNSASGSEYLSMSMMSLQNLAAGSHKFQIQATRNIAGGSCSTFTLDTAVSEGDGGMGSLRSLIVREF